MIMSFLVGRQRLPPRNDIIMEKQYFVYILTNSSGTLYTGVTSDLGKRLWEHKKGIEFKAKGAGRLWWKEKPLRSYKGVSFTSHYNVSKLIYYGIYSDVLDAIAREKGIKGWSRKKKIALIKEANPEFKDLSNEK